MLSERRHRFADDGTVEGVRKIAIVRANALGDLIFSLPAFEALRAAYPNAELILLARDWHAEFFRNRPSPIDRVIELPPIHGVSLPGVPEYAHVDAPFAFYDAMHAEAFDIAIQMHGGGKSSNPFIKRLGARLTVGMRAEDAEPLDRWIRYIYFQNEFLRYLEVVSLIGARAVTLDPRIAVLADDLDASRAAVPDNNEPIVVLHPGATDARRRWSATRYAAVGDRLAEAGARVVVTGDASEAELTASVVRAMKRPALDLAGALTLPALIGLLARAELVVGNDTGPLHLARVVGTPTVTIYWVGNMINGQPPFRHRHRAAISWTTRCPVCNVDNTGVRCRHQVSFVDGVPVEEVAEQALDAFTIGRDDRHANFTTEHFTAGAINRDTGYIKAS